MHLIANRHLDKANPCLYLGANYTEDGESHTEMSAEVMAAYESGVLNELVHSRLVMNLDAYASRASIPATMILHKMSEFGCSSDEIEYLKQIKRRADMGQFGLVYAGKSQGSIQTRMMGVAGACVRNFVDAKVMTLQEVLACLKVGDYPEATVLLISNFFVAKAEGGKIAEWQIADLIGLLYSRMAAKKQTFVYVSSLSELAAVYGDTVADHLKQNFKVIKA
jgi:hypothetical protein